MLAVNVLNNRSTDPTQTKILRARFMAKMRSHFNELKREVVGYLFNKSDQMKTGSFFEGNFMSYVLRIEAEIIFEDNEAQWMRPYAVAAFLRGLRHAEEQLRPFPPFNSFPVIELTPQMFQREIDVIQSQNLRLLKDITEVMNLQIKERLNFGMFEGLSPRQIGINIGDRIDKIGRTRGTVLAWTETIRAHAEATLDRFEFYGIGEVAGQAEFQTAEDDDVCPICRGLNGTVYTTKQARGVIPVHPRCRCVWLPVIDSLITNRLFTRISWN